jgi:hypothetical protein
VGPLMLLGTIVGLRTFLVPALTARPLPAQHHVGTAKQTRQVVSQL